MLQRIKATGPVQRVRINYTERPRLACTAKVGADGAYELSVSGLSLKDMNALLRGLDRLGDLHGITMHEELKNALLTLGAMGQQIAKSTTTP